MERIRQALDLARLERSQAGEAPRGEPSVREVHEAAPAKTRPLPTPRSIVHHNSQVFTAPAEVLEHNRIP